MIIFYIFAGLAFLSIFLLFILSLILFNRIHSCMNVAEEIKRFYDETSQNTQRP